MHGTMTRMKPRRHWTSALVLVGCFIIGAENAVGISTSSTFPGFAGFLMGALALSTGVVALSTVAWFRGWARPLMMVAIVHVAWGLLVAFNRGSLVGGELSVGVIGLVAGGLLIVLGLMRR